MFKNTRLNSGNFKDGYWDKMGSKKCYDFTESELAKEINEFYESYKANKHPVLNPTAYLLGGQSGAGKSTIHHIILDNNPNTIVIDGDRFREKHPRFEEIQRKYGREAANYSQGFANSVANALIERFSSEHYNLIIEGTCRTTSVPLRTCELLKPKGYTVNLAIMCTDKEVAWQSTIDRYNAMEARGLLPRAVPRDKYDATVDALPDNVSELYKSGKFDDIFLFNRNRECLYRLTEQPNLDPSEILRGQLLRTTAQTPKSFSQGLDDFAKRIHAENAAKPKRSQIKPNHNKLHK